MVKFSPEIYFSFNNYPLEYLTGYNAYLFNNPDYLQLQAKGKIESFHIINDKERIVLGRIHFVINGKQAYSPYRSPFGSLELNDHLDLKIIIAFIGYFLEELKNMHVQSVRIKSFPFAYAEKNSVKLCHALLETGFQIDKSEINHHLENNRNFEKNLHKMELRKLKKCKQADLQFSSEPVFNLPEVYAFIKNCRNERNQSLSMQLEELTAFVKRFPGNYFLFSAKQQEKFAACTLVVKVNEKIWYSFYPASSIEYNTISPLVFLYKNIIDHLPDEVEIFDLGTSYLDDHPNFGLINFKERLGGIASLKLSYYKELF